MQKLSISSSPSIVFLVIDDSENYRTAIASHLKTLGYKNIKINHQTPSVLNLLKTHKIGFIICEMDMPNMTGVELLNEIRNSFHISGIPFLMMGTDAHKTDLNAMAEYDVDGFINKPFSFKVLAEKINNALNHFHDPNNLEFQINHAKNFYLNKNYDEALKELILLLKKNEQSSRIRVGIAKCYHALKDFKSAEKFCKEAIEKNGNFVQAFDEMGHICVDMGNIELGLH